MRIFYLANDDDAVECAYAVYVAQGVEHEVLIGLHVACVDFNLEIEVACGVIALRYLVNLLDCVHELLD